MSGSVAYRAVQGRIHPRPRVEPQKEVREAQQGFNSLSGDAQGGAQRATGRDRLWRQEKEIKEKGIKEKGWGAERAAGKRVRRV